MSENAPEKKGIKRAANGTYLPGTAAPSGGRPTLPPWLKGHTEDLLRVQLAVALQGNRPNPDGGVAQQLMANISIMPGATSGTGAGRCRRPRNTR